MAAAMPAACPTAIDIVMTRIAASASWLAEMPRPTPSALSSVVGIRLRYGIW